MSTFIAIVQKVDGKCRASLTNFYQIEEGERVIFSVVVNVGSAEEEAYRWARKEGIQFIEGLGNVPMESESLLRR